MTTSVYGPKQTPSELTTIFDHVFNKNFAIEEKRGKRGTPLCIWGTHGIGKTQLVSEYAKLRGWKFAYAAPGQFEEMGDLHGMPTIKASDLNNSANTKGTTIFSPPEWVPMEDGPGILLLDDINRADDRILRGIMQLLQNYELFSWKLPKKWQIVATANPDSGDYSVTTMDDSMLTRMIHFNMVFQAKSWAVWANASGVDQRGIAFVLSYPECITGKRTTPRTIVQLLDLISDISDWKNEYDLISSLAGSVLDQTTMAAFLAFINDELEALPSPEEILEAERNTDIKKHISRLAKGREGDTKRVDRLSALLTRIFIFISSEGYEPQKKHLENLVELLTQDVFPNDLRMAFLTDTTKGSFKLKTELLNDHRIAELLLNNL